jgi:hypothetical protein
MNQKGCTMSEHAWTLENIAAYVAGGLDAEEGERLQRHAAECTECAAALLQARSLDHGLDALFAAARPGPVLEDRMIRSLRTDAAGRELRGRWRRKLAWSAAAAVALGATGAGVSRLAGYDELPFPGSPIAASQLKEAVLASSDVRSALSREEKANRAYREATAAVTAEELRRQTENLRSAIVLDDTKSFRWKDQPPLRGSMGEDPASFRTGDGIARDMYGDDQKRPPAPTESFFKPGDLTAKAAGDMGNGRSPDPGKSKDDYKGKEPLPPPGESKSDKPAGPPKAEPPAPETPAARKVIRTGEIEFEVPSFDGALAAVTKLVGGIKGAYVATVNSDKLANGKVKGAIVVRVPPDRLDALVLDLRKELGPNGELKGQRIASEDITKKYTDLESRLKAARTMEQRLLQIIKEGKGEIKQLLEAEKELGVWRTKIEEFEGEIRYYANQVALSTLTITLAEKDVRAAADVVECEEVRTGLEVEDVDQAQRAALAAVAEAKGRVTKSELKQHSAGQFSAALRFEVAPESAGPLRDRLKQLGNMVRLEIDRVQQPEGGTAPAPRDAKVRRGDTRFDVALYNLAKVEPRETATVRLAVADVPAAYRSLREAVEKAKGRVVSGNVNERDRLSMNVTAQLDFEVRRADERDILAALAAAGDVLGREVNRAPDGPNLTDAKVLFKTSLTSAAAQVPRETVKLGIEVPDVDATAALLAAQVADVQGRTVLAQVDHDGSGRVTGHLVYDVPLGAAPGLVERFKAAGTVRVHDTNRQPQAVEGKLALARLDVTVSNFELIVPSDDGLWPKVRKGLSYSVAVLSVSVTWLIFGLCVVLPWALVGYGGYRLVRRLFRAPAPPAT